MSFFTRIGSKFSNGINRLGQKLVAGTQSSLGRKISHQATLTLGQVGNIASRIENNPFLPPQIGYFAGAVRGATRAGMETIEAGKDLGRLIKDKDRSQLEKAVKRVPTIVSEGRNVVRNIEMATL